MRFDLSRLTRRRAAYASLATLLCGVALLAGARSAQDAGAGVDGDCTEGLCLELRRVASCEGDNCLEAVRAEGCETDQCFTLKVVEACEGDLCFQVFATVAPVRQVTRSRGSGVPRAARPAPAATPPPRPSVLQALEQLEKCKRGNCFEVKQATDCKAPPCFKAVRKDECAGPACFGVKKF